MNRVFALTMVGLFASTTVFAQSLIPGDPHNGSHTWDANIPGTQSSQSSTIAKPATGSILVPSMTRAGSEPKYRVTQNGMKVGSASPGEKLHVLPGDYEVVVGGGAEDLRMAFDVHVVEGQTTLIPVEWAGMVVTILDERGNPFRGSYELVRLPDRDFVGIGIGADLAQGERLTTWQVPSGLYMLLSPGESYQARRNFLTIRLRPGHLSHVTLVQNQSNNDILGGGELSDTSGGLELEGWDLSLVVGGSLEFSRNDAVVEKTDGSFFNIEAFAENVNRYNRNQHVGYVRAYVEESSREIKLPDQPYLKDDDKLEVETLYAYRVKPFFGPYIRGGIETHILPSVLHFEDPKDIVRVGDGGPSNVIEPNRDFLYLSPPFSNVRTRFGAGARFEGNPAPWFEVYSLFGVAARHLFTRNFFVAEDDPDTALYEVRRRGQNTLIGIEGALVGQFSITRWVLWQLECDILAPMVSLPDREKVGQPVIGISSTVGLRLASFASLNYIFELDRDPDLTNSTQLENTVLLRFAYKIF